MSADDDRRWRARSVPPAHEGSSSSSKRPAHHRPRSPASAARRRSACRPSGAALARLRKRANAARGPAGSRVPSEARVGAEQEVVEHALRSSIASVLVDLATPRQPRSLGRAPLMFALSGAANAMRPRWHGDDPRRSIARVVLLPAPLAPIRAPPRRGCTARLHVLDSSRVRIGWRGRRPRASGTGGGGGSRLFTQGSLDQPPGASARPPARPSR